MATSNQIKYGYFNIVDPSEHEGKFTIETVEKFTDGFAKPAIFKKLVSIAPELQDRKFYEQFDSERKLRWRVKQGDGPVSMRSEDGRRTDYNYVTGQVGTATEFLDDVFSHKKDVYANLGAMTVNYSGNDFTEDPLNVWGAKAFGSVKEKIFEKGWFDIDNWKMSGHMFFGNSSQEFGEPARGAVGSDWHMFPTLNVFVMIAGVKQWSTCPPQTGEQFEQYDRLLNTVGSGREASGGSFDCDIAYLEPGDVLMNVPFEWHKVLNGKGLSIGAAFRVIDTKYLEKLQSRESLDVSKMVQEEQAAKNEELAHFITSANYASRHISRAQMLLNDVEYAYLRKNGSLGTVDANHSYR